MGTTFTGAYDEHRCVDKIHKICEEHAPEVDGKKIKMCWVHMDGALGGNIAPFFNNAYNNMENHTALEVSKEMENDE